MIALYILARELHERGEATLSANVYLRVDNVFSL